MQSMSSDQLAVFSIFGQITWFFCGLGFPLHKGLVLENQQSHFLQIKSSRFSYINRLRLSILDTFISSSRYFPRLQRTLRVGDADFKTARLYKISQFLQSSENTTAFTSPSLPYIKTLNSSLLLGRSTLFLSLLFKAF